MRKLNRIRWYKSGIMIPKSIFPKKIGNGCCFINTLLLSNISNKPFLFLIIFFHPFHCLYSSKIQKTFQLLTLPHQLTASNNTGKVKPTRLQNHGAWVLKELFYSPDRISRNSPIFFFWLYNSRRDDRINQCKKHKERNSSLNKNPIIFLIIFLIFQ